MPLVLDNNYIDEARQKNGPGKQIWEPSMRAYVDNASDQAVNRDTSLFKMSEDYLLDAKRNNPAGIIITSTRQNQPRESRESRNSNNPAGVVEHW